MKFVNSVKSNVKGHSPTYLAASGCVGVITTAYLSARAAHKARDKDLYHITGPLHEPRFAKEYIKVTWKLYIPAGVSGLLTIGCILGGNRLGARRALAAQVLFAASERAYSAYRDEVVEEFGKSKDEAIRNKVAETHVAEHPPGDVLVASAGEVICCELWTGRYFPCTMEKLKKAQNELNAKLLRDDYCTMDEWYYILGIPYTQSSSEVGWRSDKLMELQFHATIHDDKPVMVFEYNYVRSL